LNPVENLPQKRKSAHRSSQQGIALLFVFGMIAVLTAIAIQFTYSSAVFKTTSINAVDDLKAYYAAKAGLRLSLLRIDAFQKIKAEVQKNKQLQQLLKPKVFEFIWSFPFVYPPIVPPSATSLQKEALLQWSKEMGMNANYSTLIRSESNKINLNRFLAGDLLPSAQKFVDGSEKKNPSNQSEEEASSSETRPEEQDFLNYLTQAIATRIEDKKDQDDQFYEKAKLWPEPQALAEAVQAWVDPEANLIDGTNQDSIYSKEEPPYTPKNGPMWDLSELGMLAGWDEDIIQLLSPHFTVQASTGWNVNKVSPKTLQMLLAPAVLLDEEVLKTLQQQRNDPDNPLYWEKMANFWSWISEQTRVDNTELQNFQDRLTKLGIRLSTSESLFRVVSQGTSGGVTKTITAMVRGGELETTPPPPPPNNQGNQSETPPPPGTPTQKPAQNQTKTVQLPPRIVHFSVQ